MWGRSFGPICPAPVSSCASSEWIEWPPWSNAITTTYKTFAKSELPETARLGWTVPLDVLGPAAAVSLHPFFCHKITPKNGRRRTSRRQVPGVQIRRPLPPRQSIPFSCCEGSMTTGKQEVSFCSCLLGSTWGWGGWVPFGGKPAAFFPAGPNSPTFEPDPLEGR